MADLPVEPRTGYKTIIKRARGSLVAGEKMTDHADVQDIAAVVTKTVPVGKKVTRYEIILRAQLEDA